MSKRLRVTYVFEFDAGVTLVTAAQLQRGLRSGSVDPEALLKIASDDDEATYEYHVAEVTTK